MRWKIAFKATAVLYLAYFCLQIVSARDFYQFSDVSYLKHVDIIFHEAGHTLFALFGPPHASLASGGHFLYVLGGSFFQVFLPLFLAGYFFFYHKELFSAGILLFWAGESATDVAFYIADAQKMAMPLLGDLGPESHDWHNILSTLGILDKTDAVAHLVFFFSWLLFAAAFCVMIYSLYSDIKGKSISLEETV